MENEISRQEQASAPSDERESERQRYRGWHLYFDPPPIPDRRMDWHFHHDDFDGAPDSRDFRCGNGPTAADCREQIDELIEEFAEAVPTPFAENK